MPIDADELKALLSSGGDKISSLLKERVAEFVSGEDLEKSKGFLEERSKRLFELGVELAKAETPQKIAEISASIENVTDAITSELWSVAVDASAATRSTIKGVVGAVKDFVLEALPIVAKIIIAAV